MKLSNLFFLFLLIFTLAACDDDDNGNGNTNQNEAPRDVTGLDFALAPGGDAQVVYDKVIASLDDVPAIGIVARVNHASAAAAAGITLKPTRVVLFGNPSLGTPLMQANQRAGLDLPQKLLVYQTADDDIVVAYNNVEYLARRHGVAGVSTLVQIGNALGNFAQNASGSTLVAADDNQVILDEGIVEVTSTTLSVDTVYNRFVRQLNANPNLNIIAELDHQANAASVNMTLRPTKLVVFGNPALGSPLMVDQRSIGIDLPQKVLVYEDENGTTRLIYNDPLYLAGRHNVDLTLEQLTTISNALANLAAAAVEN